MVTTEGRVLTIAHNDKSQICANCKQEKPEKSLRQCLTCKKTLYCPKPCQKQHWDEHNTEFKTNHENKTMKKEENHIPLPPAQVNTPHKVTSLVGRQCLVECLLDGHRLQALWDSGSQVSIIDEGKRTICHT